MKKNARLFILFSILIAVVVALIFLLVYFFNNKNNYTFKEKSWINANTNEVIDISVEGNLPLYSNNGEGVFYDFIKAVENDTHLTFNIINNGNSPYKLLNKNYISSNDVLFYSDHYVLVSTSDKKINSFSDLKEQPIGIINSDKDIILNYFIDYDLNYKEYSTISDLKNDMDTTIIYAIIPLQKYINEIIYNKYNIVNHIEGLHSYYVLTLNADNGILSSVLTKFFNKWKTNLNYGSYLLNIFYQANGLTELQKETITANDLIVGYIDNLPYEGKLNNNFCGLTNAYLKEFSDITNVTYKYIKYKNLDELADALNNKKIDIAFNYSNISNINYSNVDIKGNIEYVVISNINNTFVIDNLNSIKNTQVKMLGNTNLYNYIRNQSIDVNFYTTFKEMNKALEEDDIVIVEKSVYEYYRKSSLKNYIIRYTGYTTNNNSFLVIQDNNILNSIFSFYISTLGVKETENLAVMNLSNNLSRNIILEFILKNIIYIIFILFAFFFLVFKINKKVKITKKIKKEDKMLYLDVMTNLKNRNYLNDNLQYWEANKVYPQSIVIVDLNDIAVINDTKGHEEGDKQIQAAARILINTQRDNSEIVRTNGNEFLIYLVGYDDKQIVTYVNKLVKEFKNLPYDFGASVGYHMITTESTTIDDAINEALVMVRKNKGE